MNLIAFESRFQTICWSRDGIAHDRSGERFHDFLKPDCFRFGSRRDGGDRGVDHFGEIDRLHVQPHFAGDDPAHVEQVFDQLRLHARVALDHLQALRQILRARLAGAVAAEDLRPAEDRVQRRAQLVRERGEEFVLHPARALGLRARGAFAREQRFAFASRRSCVR